MFHKLIKKINPPGYEKTNRRKLFNIIGRLGNTVGSDAAQVLKNFFPLFADSETLKKHAEALEIPRFENDTDESFKMRVATATFYILYRGSREFFYSVIRQYFGDRQVKLVEKWMQLEVQAINTSLSTEEKDWLFQFLDKELDPNIAISFMEQYISSAVTYTDCVATGTLIRLSSIAYNY